jgi:shikimate kinase
MARLLNVVLTGFMGVGKTTIGRIVAATLDRPFIDTDERIQQAAGCSVADLFAQAGEVAFRAWEAQIAAQLALEGGLVIATGLNPANLALWRPISHIICLTAQPETICRRLHPDGSRPLLNGPDGLKRIQTLLAVRAAIYAQFPQLATDHLTPEEAARQVVSLLARLTALTSEIVAPPSYGAPTR